MSDLGLKGYLAFWTGVLVRYFRAVFEAQGEPPSIEELGMMEIAELDKGKKNRRGSGGGTATEVKTSPKRGSNGRQKTLTPATKSIPLPIALPSNFSFPTTLEALAKATNLRLDDVAFTLVESGLAQWRKGGEGVDGQEQSVLELCITPELVEEVAKLKGVRKLTMMEFSYVSL